MSQQLSARRPTTIFGRVAALVGGPRRPDAGSALLALDPAALRAAGVSRPEDLLLAATSPSASRTGGLTWTRSTTSDDEVIAAITAVKGLGRWSAEMFLMFRLNRPDIFPVGDLGIVKGMQKLFGMKRRPAERTMVRLAEGWRPYRSIACWYLWRIDE